MNLAFRPCLLLLCALAVSTVVAQDFQLPGDSQPTTGITRNGDPVIQPCQVDLVDDVQLPALDAGVLLHLGVREGDYVKSEAVIARIDDREPKQERLRAVYSHNSAVARAKNDISVRFAEAQLDVAQANLDTLKAANKGGIKAIPEQEMREAQLEVRSGVLRVDNAKHELDLAGYDVGVARVEVDTAKMMIDRRVIRAPFDGEVVEVFRQQQEWVSPGDPILRLIRLDTLNVEGWVNVDKYSFAELKGCEVTVDVPTAGGRTVQATGRVVWVDPILIRGVDSQVAKIRAEIANRQENGEWLIHPKRQATMTIHLGTGGVSAASRK